MTMKLDTERMPVQEPAVKEDNNIIELPLGIVGFPEMTQAELIYTEEELPFMRLRSIDENSLHFLVLDPTGIVPDYNVEITDEDLVFLGIESAVDVIIFNVATVQNAAKMKITVNLIGPIVINRRTGRGKQVVLGNHTDYSARHVLFEEPIEEGA